MWSLTQLYYVSFLQPRTIEKSVVLQAPSKFALVFLDSFLGPPSLAWHTWGYLCESLVPEATHELRLNALEGQRVSSKSHTRESETQMRELID